ncbi:nucleosidase [Lipingzhangella sp. LS1_29]|uniref:Nucleosidase n=1 Tax=Lipingzhangella rawalii TaxID=2055835 RepID=A0ABU2H6S9_9ACTN|nr:nucleosidase [Lipingzhangella rawalii]MDS1270996.1 nucleosidase [Lipingzhangella rawalii]
MHLRGEIRPDLPLLVVALEEEAAHLDDRLPVLVTGVGKVNAATAVATMALGSTSRPAGLVNLGTAGALRAQAGGTHEVGTVRQHDLDDETLYALTGRRFAPPIQLTEQDVCLATGDAFVADPQTRSRLAAIADLVDMEAYAVAVAARQLQLPVRVVKHVSDAADDTAAASWRDTVDSCARALAQWVRTHL